ncbi:MAG: iron-containing alcohol dehydrogenase [SAR202 cluster bacterium]|nr:iron-containing alcohol dehydrogenase [SAR202 cluster bacterium]|tara:strand:- start:6309 stop:7595 length:1287 start_codon:yes stop_codon:yes gene_type:complete
MKNGNLETAFSIDVSSIKFGPGITKEVGFEMKRLNATRVMVVTDPKMKNSEAVSITLNSLKQGGIDATLFDGVHVEPTDTSFQEAIAFATNGKFDGYIGVGGGSSIDTAKAANLYATYPAEFLTYVNAPIGQGVPVPGPIKPLLAIPTTSGTGSETTGTAIFDFLEMKAKTGIAHRYLRPAIGLIDPIHTLTLPGMVVASSGLDVLSHGLESYTALPYNQRTAPENPLTRPSYQGSNPISDIWAIKAIEMVSQNIVRAVHDPEDIEARSEMMLAATYAGVGFGNAGCHLPHGMSYAVSGMVRNFAPDGYPQEDPIVPHGMSVILNAPAVFRFTAPTNPERHRNAAEIMGIKSTKADNEYAGYLLGKAITNIVKKINIPNGLGAIGYQLDDIEALVTATLPQKRLLDLCPRPITRKELRQLFLESMTLW